MMIRAALAAITLLLLAPGLATARPTLQPDQLKALEQGRSLDFSNHVAGTNVKMGKSIFLIDDNPEAVAYVFLEIDKYKNYMPRITESRITKRSGWHTFAVVETDLPWPVKDCWVYAKFTRNNKPGRVYEIKFWMINGTMKNYNGTALIEPWTPDGKRTVITYEILFEPKTAAPHSMITDGVRAVASIFVQKLRLRLLALRKYGKLPKGL